MDFKTIDKLIKNLEELDKEKKVFLERIEKLNEKKENISEVVYSRIKGDYDKNIEKLNTEIYPLVEQIALKKSEIETILNEISEELEEVNIKKEEIEVRCELGEFSRKKADEMIKEIEEENKERFELYKKLSDYNEKIGEILKKNIELNEPEMPHYEQNEINQDITEIKDVEREDLEDAFETKTSVDDLPPIIPPEEDGTVFQQVEPSQEEGKTMLIRQPRLVISGGINENKEFRLKLGTTNIGSDFSNDIVIEHPSIEFKHVQIVFEPEGFKLYDFNSEKGVLVNNRKVKECFLKDGDKIKLGVVELTFKE